MSETLEITPVKGPIRGSARPPGSKSITNRALVCAALADGLSTLTGALDSEDTRVMIAALGQLGVVVEVANDGQSLGVHGASMNVPALEAELYCANSGTTLRFLTALSTLGHGSFRFDGIERMRQRPVKDLVLALQQLGAHVTSENDNGCPPIVVHANGLKGGTAKLRGDVSSQFLSALLMAAPGAASSVEVDIEGPLVSQPYVLMTRAVMQAFDVQVSATKSLDRFTVAPQSYRATNFAVEPDASAASYFWAAAAVTGGEVTVEGLSASSLQGDVAFVDCLAQMGCEVRRDEHSITVVGNKLRGVDVDMNAISDTMQTLAVVALFAGGITRIRNVAHVRHKETDRIHAVATELRKLGAAVEEQPDGLVITPGTLQRATIDTYNDHRMAMSFALAGLRLQGIQISNPQCVEKTYPNYFRDLKELIGPTT